MLKVLLSLSTGKTWRATEQTEAWVKPIIDDGVIR